MNIVALLYTVVMVTIVSLIGTGEGNRVDAQDT